MRIAVTGGRDFTDREVILRALNEHFTERDVMLNGMCPTGLDDLAYVWAHENGVSVIPYEADWKTHGRAAGPIRNRRMVKDCDLLIAFPGGRGTQNTVQCAERMGRPIIHVSAG